MQAMEGLTQMTGLERFRRKAVAALLAAMKKPDLEQLQADFRRIDDQGQGFIKVRVGGGVWIQQQQQLGCTWV